MKGFAVHGPRGTFIQLEKSGCVYTYDSQDDPSDPEDVLGKEKRWGDAIYWKNEPLAGDLSREEIEENCGISTKPQQGPKLSFVQRLMGMHA